MRLLTIEEVARLLQVPRGFVYRLNYERRIPGLVKLGHRTIRYRADLVEKWIIEGCPPDKDKFETKGRVS